MRRALLAAALAAAAPAAAGLFGRSKVVGVWAAAPPAIDADDAKWDSASAFEEDGLSVQAMNDASDLYLLLTARTQSARDQLNGEARQDVSLIFFGADGHSRSWGARLPFSHRAPLTPELRDPAGLDPEPEFLRFQGAAVSTSAWPTDMPDRFAAIARRPIWELKIPLSRLSIGAKGTVPLDLVISAPSAKRRRRSPERDVWDTQTYTLAIHLARDPALSR